MSEIPCDFDRMRPVKRWTPHRKYFVVQGVRDGSLSLAAVMHKHCISFDEYQEWSRAVDGGLIGPSQRRLSVSRARAAV